MKTKLKRFLCIMFCLYLPFCFASSGFNGDGGDDDEIASAENMISGVTAISTGNGDATYEEVMAFVDSLTEDLINGLYEAYGATSNFALFRDSVEDTHKNAMWQDSWLFAGKESYGTTIGSSDLWTREGLDKADYSLVMKYNLYQILLNKDITAIDVYNISSNSLYFQMKQAGDFNDDAFEKMARKVMHTGLFYYEADAIAEYVLNYVIGENAVGYDSRKFIDMNGNGTFDYNENVKSLGGVAVPEYRQTIIKNYSFAKSRADSTSRSAVWNSIEFGSAVTEPTVPSGEIAEEGAYSIEYLKTNNIANKYTINGETKYSGFKNYINFVYYLVYKSAGDVFGGGHKPNAMASELQTEDVSIHFDDDTQTTANMFNVEASEYYSVIIKAKQDLSLSSIWLYIELDDSVTESVDFKIDATYNSCEDKTVHTHSSSCVFNKISSNLGNLTIKPGKVDSESESLYADLTMTDEVIEDLKNKGLDTSGITVTEFTRNGIYSFDLSTYRENGSEEAGETTKTLVAIESGSLTGCDFAYENDFNDFLEVKFFVTSNHNQPIKFKFAFLW